VTARKHWTRVADSLGQDGTPNDVIATYVRFSAYLNTRWARGGLSADEAIEGVLTPAQAMQITGRSTPRRALRLLDDFAVRFDAAVQRQRGGIRYAWPKWAEFQNLPGWTGPGSGRKPAPPHTPPPPPPKSAEAARSEGGEQGQPEPPEWQPLLNFFKGDRRELAERVFRVQWSAVKLATVSGHMSLREAAHRFVNQAAKNPESLRWAENANARVAESRAAETGRSLKRAEQAIAPDLDALAGRMTR